MGNSRVKTYCKFAIHVFTNCDGCDASCVLRNVHRVSIFESVFTNHEWCWFKISESHSVALCNKQPIATTNKEAKPGQRDWLLTLTFTLFLSRPSPSFVIIVLLFFPGSPSFHLPLIHDPISVSSFIDHPPTTNRRHYPGALVSALSLHSHSHSHSRLHSHLGTLLDLHSHSQGSPLNKLDPNSLHPEQLHSCISTL